MTPTSTAAPRRPFVIDGSPHSHLSDVSEQVIATVLKSAFGGTGLLQVVLDTSALTKNNNRLRVRYRVDGINYRALQSTVLFNPSEAIAYPLITVCCDFQVTLQSQIAEGATRVIPYSITIL